MDKVDPRYKVQPTACPKCGVDRGFDNIDSTGYEFSGEKGHEDELTFGYRCRACGFEWYENYRFINWEPALPKQEEIIRSIVGATVKKRDEASE